MVWEWYNRYKESGVILPVDPQLIKQTLVMVGSENCKRLVSPRFIGLGGVRGGERANSVFVYNIL